MQFKINDFVVDPPVCPVTYECISIDDPDSIFTCVSDEIFNIDNATGQITVQSSDMAKYRPGDYLVTLRGSAGTVFPVFVDTTFTLSLINPCPTAALSNLQKEPFLSVTYTLGDESIDQTFSIDNLVSLDTPVDCGPILISFIDLNDKVVE